MTNEERAMKIVRNLVLKPAAARWISNEIANALDDAEKRARAAEYARMESQGGYCTGWRPGQ